MNGWFHVFWHALTLDSTFYAQYSQQPKMKRKAHVFVGIAALSHAVGSSMILLTYQTSLVLQGLAFVVNALSIVGGYYLWTFTIEKVADWLHVQIPSYKPFLILIGLTYAPRCLISLRWYRCWDDRLRWGWRCGVWLQRSPPCIMV
uniref:Uncharacterized protein n=1 Tax=Desertifilum tharense IPPAS B-1220 TaxID=1781255 RepID=A0ACD5GNY4_9CYAN